MRIPPAPTPEPSEWQTDKDGRRYRQTGNIIEYEMELNGIPRSQFVASQERQRAQREAALKAEQQKAAELAKLRRNCPFKDSMQTDCKREQCALFDGNGCTFARLKATRATEGLQCPFSKYNFKCRTDCALYKGGCTFTGITNKESEDHGQNE